MNPSFEQNPFERDFQSFSKEIKEHQEKNKIENLQETHVKDFLKSKTPPVQPVATPSTQTKQLNESDTLPDYLMSESNEIKGRVENLLALAFQDGLESAAKEAAKSGPFILDAFHDALTSKLYSELNNRGLLK